MGGSFNQFIQLLPKPSIHRQLERPFQKARVKHRVGQFHGTESLLSGQSIFSLEDGVGEIRHQDGVRGFRRGDINLFDGCFRLLEPDLLEVLYHSSEATALRVRTNRSFSKSKRPFVPEISSRLLPGSPPVEVGRDPMPIGKFHVAGNAVLHLDVVPFADPDLAVHLARHAYHPLHRIQLVQALVEKHSPALALPSERHPPLCNRHPTGTNRS